MASLGWLGIAVPEEFGGSGLGLAEVVTVVEPMGKYLVGMPLVSTTLVAQALLMAGTNAQKNEWLPKICEGIVGSLALTEPSGDWGLPHPYTSATRNGDMLTLKGTKTFVTDAASADLVIVSVTLDGKPALVLLDKDTLGKAKLTREIVIDETRRSYRLELDGISIPSAQLLDPTQAAAALTHLEQAACLLLSAEACGGASGVIDVVVDYLKTRIQPSMHCLPWRPPVHISTMLPLYSVRVSRVKSQCAWPRPSLATHLPLRQTAQYSFMAASASLMIATPSFIVAAVSGARHNLAMQRIIGHS